MNADLRSALRIQEFDLRIAELKEEIALLPRQIAEIEKQLSGHLKRLEADKAALAANQRDRKKLDGDIQVHQQKISKLRDQMLQAKTNEQYRAFQNEIAYAETEIRKCEDQILELMEKAEGLEKAVRIAEANLAEEKKSVEAEKSKAKARTAQDQTELNALLQQRAQLSPSIAKQVLDTYERLRVKMKNGVAIAEARRGLCTGCRMMLRPQFIQELRAGEQVLQCENCRRILYIAEDPVDVAEQMNG